eukprot:SM000100S09409  [mRNA]  locus=s100:206714:209770:+ [translate_table: standard]
MECLHRFCRECIDKAMRLGNNECPACRAHCASRRSLRDDPNFDALVAALYPDVDQYEEEETALLDHESQRNKQIQDHIAQTYERQAQALQRRRHSGTPQRGGSHRGRGRGLSRSPGGVGGAAPRVLQHQLLRAEGDAAYSSSASEESEGDAVQEWAQESKGEQDDSHIAVGEAFTSTDGGQMEETVTFETESSRIAYLRGRLASTCSAALFDALVAAGRESAANMEVHFSVHPAEQATTSDSSGGLQALERPHLCCLPSITIGQLCKFLKSRLTLPPYTELELLVEGPRQGLPGSGDGHVGGSSPALLVLASSLSLGGMLTTHWDRPMDPVLLFRLKPG